MHILSPPPCTASWAVVPSILHDFFSLSPELYLLHLGVLPLWMTYVSHLDFCSVDA